MTHKVMTKGLQKALDAVGGEVKDLAKAIGLSKQAIYKWHRIPAERVQAVAKATGISPKELRPDIYQGYIEDK